MSNQTQNPNVKNKGFSLLELLIVIVIIGILSTVSLLYYQNIRKGLLLQRAANRLAQDIRRAQEMAMASQEEKSCKDPSRGYHNKYVSGYGIAFGFGEGYVIFADCDGNRGYNPTGRFHDINQPLAPLEITNDQLSSDSNPETKSIVFVPPDPAVYIMPSSLNEANIKITINGKSKTVKVNPAGLITVE